MLLSITWIDSILVAGGKQGVIITSPDGIIWIQRNTGTTMYLMSVISAGSQLVAVGEYGTALTSSLQTNIKIPTSSHGQNNLLLRQTPFSLFVTLPNTLRGQDMHARMCTAKGNKVVEYNISGTDNKGILNLNIVIQTVKTVYADHWPIKGTSKLSTPILFYKVSI